ncbi:MAG: hypothetical protein ACRELV_11635, partial [Longimicrobiales bacterium]
CQEADMRMTVLAVFLATAGCSLPDEIPPIAPPVPAVGDVFGDGDITTGVGRKYVASKDAPATLIADDATQCLVPGDRFESTDVGDRVWCNWRRAGHSGGPGAS